MDPPSPPQGLSTATQPTIANNENDAHPALQLQNAVSDAKPATSNTAVSRFPRWMRNIYSFMTYTPKRCRWDPSNPPKFGMPLNFLFAFAACMTVANLYYTHPILNILAADFGVSDERVSVIPTLAQAGYAVGLVLLAPLGDLFRRRAFVILLVFLTATLWYVSTSCRPSFKYYGD